jgi:hypothetical protein
MLKLKQFMKVSIYECKNEERMTMNLKEVCHIVGKMKSCIIAVVEFFSVREAE